MRVKLKVYMLVVRPALLYDLETAALTKRQGAELKMGELKMLRFSLGVMRMDRIKRRPERTSKRRFDVNLKIRCAERGYAVGWYH